MAPDPRDIVWQPQPGPQQALVTCPYPEIFYGGARGGGKTDGIIGKLAIKSGLYGKYFNAVIFRREVPQADDLVERGNEIFTKLGAKFATQHKTWRFPSGGRIRIRPLEQVSDTEKYQGQNLTDVIIEEAGNYPDPAPIDRMHGALRSGRGVPCQMILTGNPGGPGQTWIKERYIDPYPAGMKLLTRKLPNGGIHKYIYIPSRLTDNKILLKNDPDYINRLYLVGSEALVRAWLEGDFNAVEGAFFDCWATDKHVIPPMKLPRHWLRFRSMDWGSAAPFSVNWWAIASEDLKWDVSGRSGIIPKGAMVQYREWYGASKPNVGLKMTAEAVAHGIIEREDEKIRYCVLDPSAFAEDGGPSIAERMYTAEEDLYWQRADNKRTGRTGAMGGWDQMRARLIGFDGRPMMYFFDTCIASIRTIPILQHDVRKPEDLDTTAEDHAADSVRYACMSRPWTAPSIEKKRPIDSLPTFNEVMNAHKRKQQRMRIELG